MTEKIVVPKEKIEEILKMNHDHMLAGHLGVAKSLARIKRQYLWPGLGNEINMWAIASHVLNAKPTAQLKHHLNLCHL